MSHRHHQYLDLYCCLPHEYFTAYPQQRSSFYYRQKKRNSNRNINALEPTSSSRLSKCKPKNSLHPYKISKDHYANYTRTSGRGRINKIMSIESLDHEVEFYMVKEPTKPVRHHHSSQMADGDKKNEKILKRFFDKFQQQSFTNDQEHVIDMRHKDIIRPVPCKSIFDDRLKQPSNLKSFKNSISQSTLSLNRTSTWRKLQANITPSQYNHIQREHQQHPLLSIPQPIMLSPLSKQSEIEKSETSKVISNITNSDTSSMDSSTNLTDSNSHHNTLRSIHVDQQISDDDDNSNAMIAVSDLPETTYQSEIYSKEKITTENEGRLLKNDHFTNMSVQNSPNASSSQEIESIEEFQPVTEIVSPSPVPSIFINDIISSFFPTIPTSPNSNPLIFHSHHHHTNDDIGKTPYMLFDNTSDMTELLLIDQSPILPSSFIQSNFISDNQQPKKVHSLFESIEELCHLIRKLLQHELTEQKITVLQTTIANQLAILLTYLAIPTNQKIISELIIKDTIERMTSTDEDDVMSQQPLLLTIGTQTDIEQTIQLNDQISKTVFVPSNDIHFHTELVHDLIEFETHKSSSFENKQEEMIKITPPSSSSQKTTSHTELMSTSVTLHLPGRRPNQALSDTFIYHIHHHQQYSSSYHHLNSFSDTTIHSLMHRWSTKEKTQHLLKRFKQKFQHYIELESSNTCLEASTEFTPDFLLTTINNSKYDDDDDDQTEQFGIDTEKKDYQSDTISLIINKNQEQIDTLTFNSTEKENYDSLELDIEQNNEEHSLSTSFDILQPNQHLIHKSNKEEEENIPKNSITELNSHFLNNTTSLSLNNDLVSSLINQLNNKKHFSQPHEPLLNTYQWQVPILPRKTTSIDMIYEKRTAKIDFKHLKIRSNSNNGINFIGKRVRIKSNSSPSGSTLRIKPYLSQEQLKKSPALNYNNNYNEHIDPIRSLKSSTSIVDTRLSSTSIDSLYSLDSDTLDRHSANQCSMLPENRRVLMNYSESDELILHSSLSNVYQNRNNLIKTASSSAIMSSHLSDVTGKLDSNIALAENLLDMLDSLNNNNSSTMKIDLLHMYIRQFLIEFDARIRLDRKRRRKNCTKRHKEVIH